MNRPASHIQRIQRLIACSQRERPSRYWHLDRTAGQAFKLASHRPGRIRFDRDGYSTRRTSTGKGRRASYEQSTWLVVGSIQDVGAPGAAEVPLPPGSDPGHKAQSPGSTALSPGYVQSTSVHGLPPELAEAAKSLGERAGPAEIKALIRRLCAWRALRPSDLAAILRRDQEYIQKQYLRPMVREGALEFTKPDPADPQQEYRAGGPRSGAR